MDNKIAFVIQRYGKEVNGGAESLCRELAEHMTSLYKVDVFTSCARVYAPWDNYFSAGLDIINGVNVYRFPVEKTNNLQHSEWTEKMKKGDESVNKAWIACTGPYCPSFIPFLKQQAAEYKAIIFFTYNFYLTVEGLDIGLKNSVFLPTAHNEPNLFLPIYKNAFQNARAFLYLTTEERDLVFRHFRTEGKPSRLGCAGVDIPEEKEYALPENIKEYKDNYILYVGRVCKGKDFQELNRNFIEYKKRNPSNLKLIVVGRIDNSMGLLHSEDIIYAGFVSEGEKTAIMQHAKLLVMPSLYESLSLVILESMAVKRPVLVNGNCAVLKGQCIRSNAGLYYSDYFEFEGAINFILSNSEAYAQMCENGFRFVKENYDWNVIVDNVSSLIEEIQE